ncbi:MAG TPA: TetR/AcrR family transcriptional regulator [Clostridium sp.]|uniref:TetR/AcrR family transcriptional regulator n=1 Tax=Clostridium sp. TaxID=1506 RepID=UPI002F940F82
MFSKFLNLKKEKQKKILEATIREFADKGFDKASTNEIVKEAGISKGILFHYFKNKKNLFLFVFDYCAELCLDEFLKKVNFKETDFFAKLRQIASLKLELSHKYPEIFKFFEVAMGEESTALKGEIEERKKKISESSYSKVLNNIDMSKFRHGVDAGRAINIVMWTLDGFGTSELQKAKLSTSKQLNYEKTLHEMDIYIDMFKNCFY